MAPDEALAKLFERAQLDALALFERILWREVAPSLSLERVEHRHVAEAIEQREPERRPPRGMFRPRVAASDCYGKAVERPFQQGRIGHPQVNG